MSDISKLLQKFSKYGVISGKDVYIPQRITTGIDTLDIITGGGYPTGRIIELYGAYSVGKTLAALKTVAANQKLGKVCVWVDAEATFDAEWAIKQGVDVQELIIQTPEYGEQSLDFIKDIIAEDISDVIVLDSIEGVVPKSELENLTEKQQMGVKARLMNKAVRGWNTLISSSQRKPTIICINQLRDTMDMWNPTTTPGGQGMKYFASMRVELRKGKTQKDSASKEDKYREIRATVEKNKVSTPGKFGYWTQYLGENEAFPQGYTDCSAYVISKAKDIGLVRAAGKWFYYNDEKYDGKSDFMNYLYDNQEIYNNFLYKIIHGSGINGGEANETEISDSGEDLSEETEW